MKQIIVDLKFKQIGEKSLIINIDPSSPFYDCVLGTLADRQQDDTFEYFVLNIISNETGIPSQCIQMDKASSLLRSSQFCVSSDRVSDIISLNESTFYCSISLKNAGLLGGKGGFGATLRASGSRTTSTNSKVDFGFCRDLQGRRLRHVNNELRLQHWREQQQQRQIQNQQGASILPSSQSGNGSSNSASSSSSVRPKIDEWYLDIPSWTSISKKRMKGKKEHQRNDPYKTTICREWEQYRKVNHVIPSNAPSWLGCSKGPSCRYAHGEGELREYGVEKYKKLKKQKIEEEVHEASKELVKEFEDNENAIAKSVSHGLKLQILQKKKKKQEQQSEEVKNVAEETKDLADQDEEGDDNEESSDGDVEIEPEVKDIMTTIGAPLQGDVGVGETGEIEGRSSFATFALLNNVADKEPFYYEVEIMQNGNLQLGWATKGFLPNEAEGDGVGDVVGSWAIDIDRKKFWKQGIEVDVPISDENKSAKETIVGCYLDIKEGIMSFSLNGTVIYSLEKEEMQHIMGSQPNVGLFPALSLELGVAVRINIGNDNSTRPFKYGVPKQTSLSTTEGSKDSEHIDLQNYQSATALQSLGAERLKHELNIRGLKVGGNVQQRAERLFAVKGLTADKYPPQLKR